MDFRSSENLRFVPYSQKCYLARLCVLVLNKDGLKSVYFAFIDSYLNCGNITWGSIKKNNKLKKNQLIIFMFRTGQGTTIPIVFQSRFKRVSHPFSKRFRKSNFSKIHIQSN